MEKGRAVILGSPPARAEKGIREGIYSHLPGKGSRKDKREHRGHIRKVKPHKLRLYRKNGPNSLIDRKTGGAKSTKCSEEIMGGKTSDRRPGWNKGDGGQPTDRRKKERSRGKGLEERRCREGTRKRGDRNAKGPPKEKELCFKGWTRYKDVRREDGLHSMGGLT